MAMNALYKGTGLLLFGLSLISCDALNSTSAVKNTIQNNHFDTTASSLDKPITTTAMSDHDFNKLTRAIQPNFSDKPLPQSDIILADKNKRSDCGFDIHVADLALKKQS